MTETFTRPEAQAETSATPAPILEIVDVYKSFGGVQALAGVSFSVRAGEVHAICGENGAGKSTLMNILAGVYPYDSGEIRLDGRVYAPSNPHAARASGISIVFQELALFPTLPVDANLYAGREIERGLQLDHGSMIEGARATLRQMRVDLPLRELVGDLSIGQQQWVEIARAINDEARVLILDEPNSALNQYETEALFSLIRHLKALGITVLYISHRLEEVFQIADRVTVLRDGQHVATWAIEETSISQVISAMVGRQVDELFQRQNRATGDVVLQVDRLAVADRLAPTTFHVRAGEVVGFAGLTGAGIDDLFAALFGVRRASQGEVRLDGQPAAMTSPRAAMKHAVGMVPADRRRLGLMLNWSVRDNINLAVLSRLSRFGLLRHHAARRSAEDYVARLRIVTERLDKTVLFLSGGNQQKTLLARWLATHPRVLILDDPTRGIDVGAKQEIYHLIDQIASEGVAVLLTSSEIEETLALSNRILVFRRGRMVADVPASVADKALIAELAGGDLDAGLSDLQSRLTAAGLTGTDGNGARPDTAPLGVERQPTVSVPEPTPTKTARASAARLIRLSLAAREFGVLQALLVVIVLFALQTPHFFTPSNLLLITRQMAILGVMTVGMTFVLASGEVDLSVGWIYNMVMRVMATVMLIEGVEPWLAVPVGLALGTFLGLTNGLLAVALELPTIIVTLGTMTLYRGLSLSLNNGRTISQLPDSTFFDIGSRSIGPVSYLTIIMVIVFVVGAWILRNTRFARHLLIMGSNRQGAERVGIPIRRLRVKVLAFNGLMCGIAGALGLSFLGAADSQSGTGYELTVIAAAIIGGAQLGGGSGTIWGSLIGIALIMTIQNGLSLIGLASGWQIAATGFVIIVAVAVDYLTRGRRKQVASASGEEREAKGGAMTR